MTIPVTKTAGESSLDLRVDGTTAGLRLDVFLSRVCEGLSRRQAQRLIDGGRVFVDGAPAPKGRVVAQGERVAVMAAAPRPRGDDVAIEVLFEDPWLVVVNKPAGVATHRNRDDEPLALADRLLVQYPEMNGVGHRQREPGILHRLDTDTSGVLLAARDGETFALLLSALRDGAIDKQYLAVCVGDVPAPQVIDQPLDVRHRRRVRTVPAGRPARTVVVESVPHGLYSLVRLSCPSATRHQIRVHLAAIGHPLLGDELYGGPPRPLPTGGVGHLLHAASMAFSHPHTGQLVEVVAALPEEMSAVLSSAKSQIGAGSPA